MLVFMMMAVGLNIVVGYAGLLDLGYVAFYAMGAYTAAWFASLQFAHQTSTSARSASTRTWPGSTSRSGSCSSLAGVVTALVGILIGLPTLRLRGDYLAIVTLGFGEILPQVARNSDNFFRLQPDERAERDHAARPDRLRPSGLERDGRLPAGQLPHVLHGTLFGHQIQSTDVFFWTAIVLLLFTVFCSLRLQYSRLGRAWIAIREDETAAAAMGIPLMRTKTWAYATGAFFGGIAGAYYAIVQERHVPRRLLLQHLGVHPLHGHPRRHGERLRRDRRRGLPRVPEPGGPREHRRVAQRAHLRDRLPADSNSTSRCSRPASTG